MDHHAHGPVLQLMRLRQVQHQKQQYGLITADSTTTG
jgi:hypothetical protein